jgi:cell division protein FtsB
MKSRLHSLVNNKYAYVVIALLLYIVILEDTDLLTLVEYRQNVSELKNQKEYYEKEISVTQLSITELTTDQGALEKFAREQHYMKRKDEDLFVLLDQSSE